MKILRWEGLKSYYVEDCYVHQELKHPQLTERGKSNSRWVKAEVLRLEHTPESPGRLVKIQTAGPHA